MTTQIKVLVVDPDANCHVETITNDAAGLRSLLNGWLEAVGGVLGQWIAYGDEEGNLKGLPQNPLATGLIMAAGGMPVTPVGRVVFVGQTYVGGEDGYEDGNVPRDLLELAFPGVIVPPEKDL